MIEIPKNINNVPALTHEDVRPGLQFAIIDWRLGTLARAMFTTERYLRCSCQEGSTPEWFASTLPIIEPRPVMPHIPLPLHKIGITADGQPSAKHPVTTVALANEANALKSIFGEFSLKNLMEELGVSTYVIGMPSRN